MKAIAVLSLTAALAAAQPRPASPAKAKTATPPAKASTAAPATPAAQAAPSAPANGPVVIRIGSETVSAAEFEALIESLPEHVRAQARGPAKRQVAEQIVRVKLLAAEARKKGLDKDETLQARIQFQTDNLLAGAAYGEISKSATVDESAVRKYYDEHKGEYETASAKHILVKFKGSPVPQREGKPELSEEQALEKANEIRKRLLGGEDFAELAKAESDDTGSGANGGDLGNFGRGQMVPEFEKAVFSQPVGEVGEPVKSAFGYHVIKVEERTAKGFDDVRGEIESRLRPEKAREAVEEMRNSAAVTLDESFFGPNPESAPAQAPAPAGANTPAVP